LNPKEILWEFTTAGGAGARGATGQAKLQAELASQKGLFFKAVTQSMARRMAPTLPSDLTSHQQGISGVRYLERFGGYGRQRELGQLQCQVMTCLDFMMADQIEAAKDTLALLAVSIEQACVDGGRMDLANLLCLPEDTPAAIFVNRQMTIATSRLCPTRRSALGHAGLGVSEGARSDPEQEARASGSFNSFRQFVRSSHHKAQGQSKAGWEEKGGREGPVFSGRGGGLEGGGQASQGTGVKPFEATTTFDVWAICIPRLFLKCRTSLAGT
jgi:hypothetical protein